MNKLYVVGSSSKIAESIERLSGENFSSIFFGRNNPLNLKNYVQYSGINNEDSVDELENLIFKDLEQSDDLETVSLIILSGVSTNNWRESYLVNEYLPAKLSENFAKKVSNFMALCDFVYFAPFLLFVICSSILFSKLFVIPVYIELSSHLNIYV